MLQFFQSISKNKLSYSSYSVESKEEVFSFTGSYDYRNRVRLIEVNQTLWMAVWMESNGHSEGNDNHINISFAVPNRTTPSSTTWTTPNTYIGGGAISGFPYFGLLGQGSSTANIVVAAKVNSKLILIVHDRDPVDGFLPHSLITSDDNGATWSSPINATSGWEGSSTVQWALYDVHVEGSDLYIGYSLTQDPYLDNYDVNTKFMIFKSSDYGVSWTKVGDVTDIGDNPFWGAGLFKEGKEMVLFGRSLAGENTGPVIVRSSDRGVTWGGQVIKTGLDDGVDQCTLKKFTNDDTLYAFGRNGNNAAAPGYKIGSMWWSTDFGDTWDQLKMNETEFRDGGPCDGLRINDDTFYVIGGEGDFDSNITYRYIVKGVLE